MENILFIQSEKFGVKDYLFRGENRIEDKNEMVKIVSNNILLKSKLDITFKKNHSPFTEIIKRIPFGYLIKGQLNEKDHGGRYMGFTCFYNGSLSELELYLNSCFNQINKSCNSESLTIIKNSISNYNLLRNIILGLVTISVGIWMVKLIQS